MSPPRVLTEWPSEWIKRFFPEKGPGKKDDVDFMGVKREKILDFGPIGTVRECIGQKH
jgi:hypothetical protein